MSALEQNVLLYDAVAGKQFSTALCKDLLGKSLLPSLERLRAALQLFFFRSSTIANANVREGKSLIHKKSPKRAS